MTLCKHAHSAAQCTPVQSAAPHVAIAKMQKGDGILNGFMGHQAKWFISLFCLFKTTKNKQMVMPQRQQLTHLFWTPPQSNSICVFQSNVNYTNLHIVKKKNKKKLIEILRVARAAVRARFCLFGSNCITFAFQHSLYNEKIVWIDVLTATWLFFYVIRLSAFLRMTICWFGDKCFIMFGLRLTIC